MTIATIFSISIETKEWIIIGIITIHGIVVIISGKSHDTIIALIMITIEDVDVMKIAIEITIDAVVSCHFYCFANNKTPNWEFYIKLPLILIYLL